MKIIKSFFYDLHLTEASFFDLRVENENIFVQVEKAYPCDDYPWLDRVFLNGTFVFLNCVSSQMKIARYRGDPRGEYLSSDDVFFPVETFFEFVAPRDDGISYEEFELGGFLVEPPAWIGPWTISAERFEFHVNSTTSPFDK